MSALFSVVEIQSRIEEHLDEIEAINAFAETKNRDLSDEESDRQSVLLNKVKGLEPKLAEAKEFEALQRKRKPQQSSGALAGLPRSVKAPKTWDEPQWDVPYAVRGSNPQLKAFQGKFAVENAYAAGMQLASMMGHDYAQTWCNSHDIAHSDAAGNIFNIQTEGAGSAGGFSVPNPLAATVIEFRERASLARRVCDVIPMGSDTMAVPKLTAGQTVYYPGEATAITLSDTTWAQVNLTAVKRATLTKVSRELQADSLVRMADRVASRAGYQLAFAEDGEFILGDGTSTYGGEVGLTGANGAGGQTTGAGNLWSELTLANFHACVGSLPDEFHEGASWICSRAFFHTTIEALVVAQGGSTGAELSMGAQRQFLGYPINFTSKMPTAAANSSQCIFFGNYSDAVLLGTRDSVQVATSDEYAFNTDVTTIRVTDRYDINVHHASDASTAKAVVSIITAAS